ncbi:MAG: endonuclease III [Alphaproteobacteria bacterium]
MDTEKIYQIFARLAEKNPNPETELVYHNHFTLLCAVVLSAQSTDVGVNKATKNLFIVADNPEAMVKLGEDGIKQYIKTLGLFNAKARNLYELSRILVAEHGSIVPNNREMLEKLPGVGRKTANVVLNIAFGQPTIAVDTHIFRVSNRTGLATGKTPDDVEQGLLAITPAEFVHHAHHWLILHGRYICKARSPQCHACPISACCAYYNQTH